MSLAGLALAVATQVWAGLSRSLTTTTMVVLCRELYIIIYLVKMASTLWHCRWRTRPTKDPVVRSIQLLRELTGVNQTNRVSYVFCLVVRPSLKGRKHGAFRPQKSLRHMRDREVGGSGIFISNTYSLHCHHQNDSAFRWAAVRAILMFH